MWQLKDIPVIFVTARVGVEDEVRGFAVGAVDYLTKPVQAAIVRARVATHLALRSAREVVERQNREIKKLKPSASGSGPASG